MGALSCNCNKTEANKKLDEFNMVIQVNNNKYYIERGIFKKSKIEKKKFRCTI